MTDRIHVEEPRRDWRGRIIPGQFVRRITVETPPKPIEQVVNDAKKKLRKNDNRRSVQ